MALISMPSSPSPLSVKWSLRQPTQVNRSEWTGRRKVTVLAGAPRWTAEVTLPRIVRREKARPWLAFLAACQGQANSFRLPIGGRPQIPGAPKVLVNGGGQTGYTLITDGWGTDGWATEGLPAGSFVAVNDQLLQLTADAVPVSGAVTLAFKPYLLAPPLDNAVVEVAEPYAVMAMSQDDNGWTQGMIELFDIAFACEEAR